MMMIMMVIQAGTGGILRTSSGDSVTLTGLASPPGSGIMAADSSSVQIPVQNIPENSYIVAEFSLKPEAEGGQEELCAPDSVEEVSSEQHEILATIPLSSSLTIARAPPACDALSTALNSVTGGEVSQSSERPFVCPHCSADFIRQSNLSVHMMKAGTSTLLKIKEKTGNLS